MGRNPLTKEKKVISKRNVILFKPSKEFKAFINLNKAVMKNEGRVSSALKRMIAWVSMEYLSWRRWNGKCNRSQ